MFSARIAAPLLALAVLAGAPPALAQEATPGRDAVQRLAFMQGEWVGEATGTTPEGASYRITQTERIGPMLGGDILAIEGRGYDEGGATVFNAFAVVSWDDSAGRYEMRSYAMGRSGTFPFTLTDDGYVWEVPAGPGVMRYEADVTPTTYHEVGDFVMDGQPARRVFEMTLTRRGDTAWPAGDPVAPN